MKKCVRCSVEKPLDDFPVRLRNRDGRIGYCRECAAALGKAYAQANRALRNAKHKEWAAKNKEKLRGYYEKQKLNNSHRLKESAKKWREKNQDKIKQYSRNHYERNREKVLEKTRNRPKELNCYYTRMYQTRRLLACPKWLTVNQKKEIKTFYDEARRKSAETGKRYEVDHIVPLKGKTVCGLHVPWNLQVLLGTENASKHNRHGEP